MFNASRTNDLFVLGTFSLAHKSTSVNQEELFDHSATNVE